MTTIHMPENIEKTESRRSYACAAIPVQSCLDALQKNHDYCHECILNSNNEKYWKSHIKMVLSNSG